MVAMAETRRPRSSQGGDQKQRRSRQEPRRGGRDDEQDDGGVVSTALRYVKDGARAASEQLQRTLGDTTGAVLDTVLDEAERVYHRQRKQAVSRVSSLSKIAARSAHALHAVKADAVADYVEQAARQVEQSTRYLRDRELTEVLEDAGEVVRRHRAATAATMFVLGFAATRFLMASASRGQGDDESGGDDQDEQRPKPKRRR